MRRELFTKLLVTFIGALGLAGLLVHLALAHQHDLLAVALVAALAALVAFLLMQVAAQHLDRINRFARLMVNGRLDGRVDDPGFSALADASRHLDQGIARIEQEFRALEGRRRELETLLDSMQEAVLAVDAQSRVHWANSVMERVVEPLSGPVRIGRSLVQTLRDPAVLACVEQAIAQRSNQTGRAFSIAPGRTFEVNAAPTPGGGAVVVLHDVTEVGRVERSLRDFIANVSHELRTPLTSISGYVETLRYDERMPVDTQEFLQIILRNATRMQRLIEDLLALARVESGEFRPQLVRVPARRLVDDADAFLSGMLRDTGVALERDSVCATAVFADPDSIQQVFSNLIENAVRYGGADNMVSIGAHDSGDAVEFYVRDRGAGIASEHIDRIFERFYRVDKARSQNSGGTGLGLAIAQHVMLAHGGSIRAESELHKGSTFYFTLPAAPHEENVADSHNEAIPDNAGTTEAGSV